MVVTKTKEETLRPKGDIGVCEGKNLFRLVGVFSWLRYSTVDETPTGIGLYV